MKSHNNHQMNNKSVWNLLSGVSYQLINTLLGLVLPYLFITSFGSETNGLLSSVTQLFVYLDLLEAGVGTASLQALYKPLSRDNKDEINGILSATNSYYKKTGIIYALLMVVLAFLYPLFISSSLSYTTIVLVVLLQGMGCVITYFVQAKYNVLLKAEGKVYIVNATLMITSILRNAGKIIAIYFGGNVITVQLIHFCIMLLQALIIYLYIKKKYTWLDLSVKANKSAISQKNFVLVQSLAWVVFNHTDVMVLTVITGNLALVSVYSIYTLVFEAVQNLLDSVRGSFQYRLGWKSQVSVKEFEGYYHRYENFYLAFAFALFLTAYLLIIPFLKIYLGDVNDADYFLQFLPELFMCLKILNSIRGLNKQVIEATGHFKKTQFIAIGEMIINLLVSLILVVKIGIYGVLIGTIVALIFSVLAYLYYVNKHIFARFYLPEIMELLIYFCMIFVLTHFIKKETIIVSSYYKLVIRAIPVAVVVFFCFGVVSVAIDWNLTKKTFKLGRK